MSTLGRKQTFKQVGSVCSGQKSRCGVWPHMAAPSFEALATTVALSITVATKKSLKQGGGACSGS